MVDKRVLFGGFAAGVAMGWVLIAGASWIAPKVDADESPQQIASAQAGAFRRAQQLVAAHNYSAALQIIKPQASAGRADAQFELAEMYWNGLGLPVNRAEAVRWAEQAGSQGSIPASKALAGVYYRGEGVTADPVEARHWMLRAATAGDRDSQKFAGAMMIEGYGGAPDEQQGAYWLTKAANAGDTMARAALQQLASDQLRQQLALWILQRRMMEPDPVPIGLDRGPDPAGSMLPNIMPSVPFNAHSSGMYEPFDTPSSPLASEPSGIDPSAGAIDSRTGQYLPSDGASGFIDPRTGSHYTQIDPNGAINDRTGSYASIPH